MLNFRELTLDDKPNITRVLTIMQPELSDYTFTNLYMWRHTYGLKVAYDESLDYWFMLAQPSRWKSFFFAPLGDWSDKLRFKSAFRLMEDYCREHQFQLFFRRAPENFLTLLREYIPGIHAREDRNTFDYVYNTTDLIELSGRKLHGKRNHLNQFLRSYTWEYQSIDPSILDECINLHTEWFDLQTTEKDRKISGETRAMLEVLNHYRELELVGGIIRIDGNIEALTMGEKLNQRTAVIHIEKANIEYKGIYAAINQQFVTNQWADMVLINREEDMGIEGLRQAKLAYNPVALIKKYNIYQ